MTPPTPPWSVWDCTLRHDVISSLSIFDEKSIALNRDWLQVVLMCGSGVGPPLCVQSTCMAVILVTNVNNTFFRISV